MTNRFVEAFTPAEIKAVADLRQTLPELTKTAADAGSGAPLAQLWGVALDRESDDERLDVVLVKFLRAKNLDVNAAAAMIAATLVWRKEFAADSILDETFPEGIYDGVGFIHKTDRDGRPVCYNVYGGIDTNRVFNDIDQFVRWRIQLMEKSIKSGVDFVKVDSMIQVHDYDKVSMFGGQTANSKLATKKIIALMQENYPEFLAKKFFVNVPWWGATIFRLVRPMLSASTVQKFVVCSADSIKGEMTQFIDEDSLPVQYGGTSEVPVTKVAAKEEPDQTVEIESHNMMGVD